MIDLETERLVLRPFRESDLDDACTVYGDAEVMKYLDSGALDRAATAARLTRMLDHWQLHGFGMWAVIRKADQRFLGRCGFVKLEDGEDYELGYTFARPYWGHGYATEAARAAVAYGFKERKLPRIIALTLENNTASRNVMRKLGMTFVEVKPYRGHDALWHRLDNPYPLP